MNKPSAPVNRQANQIGIWGTLSAGLLPGVAPMRR
jgi:hypothetical protein